LMIFLSTRIKYPIISVRTDILLVLYGILKTHLYGFR